nr:immunoglobulin light chain junction region [Macaca mulatta]
DYYCAIWSSSAYIF